ncbi:MAG: hypothetical protein HOU81_06845 [Hamadaea sp.]|uniref:ubiquitin-activating E1 FCCH domain-containing protein n=1 Tax=Hamadaea sp. TaxID=2024425 RepID=UPI0017D39198|nr:ubiquitin-activating E1 FCCH domain-containing protein [Hamadaea sp.]NUR70519.1 hypothetical protein [Hamadaea sp.]NUT18126.1 hypothetical protein [Hamadaea sp.]
MHDRSPAGSPAADAFAAAEAAMLTPEPTGTRRTGRRQALAALGFAGAALAGSQALPGIAQAGPPKKLDAGDGYGSVDELRTNPGTVDGQQVHLVGYAADRPGVGGGLFYWDADATEADNGGTVIAPTGVATGRWKRPVEARIDLAWFGWTGVGDVDDSPKVRAAVAALPTGGIIETGPGKVRLESTIEITSIPILFQGAGATDVDDYSTQYVVATGNADGFRLKNVHGGGMRDLVVRGSGLTGGSLVATEAAGTDRNYMVSFINVRFKDGYNGMTLRSCNTIRFRNCVWNGFNGQYVILLNGVGDTSRADPIEFVQCGIAAGPANTGVDNIVIDGLGGSIKFFAVAVLFGRHGIWLKNTTGGSYPKFLYFEGGGFENGHGYPVLLEAGAQAQFANVYISADNELSNVRITEGFTSTATFTGCIVRGCGHNGLDIASTRVTVTGCVIGNNGRTAHPAFARTITGASSGSGGKVRLTTGAEHGWETGDRVSVLDVTGTTEANGKWSIDVVSPTAFEIPVQFTHAYAGGGSTYRHGTGINIRSAATRVVVVGNAIGGLADGINRQDYGIVSASPDVLVADNDLNGNVAGPYSIVGSITGQTRFTGNKGVEQIDGRLVARVGGAVADGLYDFGNLLYLEGQRIRIVKVSRKLGVGSADVRLDADTQSAGGNAIGVTTTTQTTALTSPFTVDGSGTPLRLRLRVLNAASASDLEVQFAYQILG